MSLLITAFKDLSVLSANVQNAYLNAPPLQKAWVKG